jgi:hypothetical protein
MQKDVERDSFIDKLKAIPRKELSDRTGVSYSYLSAIINGFTPLSKKIKKRIEEGLNVNNPV